MDKFLDYMYDDWIRGAENKQTFNTEFTFQPKISILLTCINNKKKIDASIQSVVSQIYQNWELCIIHDIKQYRYFQKKYKQLVKSHKVKVKHIEKKENVAIYKNEALKLSSGEYIAFLECGDILAKNALYEIVEELNRKQVDVIYSDEDKIDWENKKRCEPFFKPEWSPDTLMSFFYMNNLTVYRKSLIDSPDGIDIKLGESAEYDLALRITEKTDNIKHISKVLYHSDKENSDIVSLKKGQKECKENALKRRGIEGRLEYVDAMQSYRVNYVPSSISRVSIIIPSKDNFSVLKRCVESLVELTEYKTYELILVDNGSNEKNKELYTELANKYNIKYIYQKNDFNFSQMCNLGTEAAKGDYYLFLNDDIEIISSDWLERMLGHACLEHIGAVGAKLLYPESKKIQHTGVICVNKLEPIHAFYMENDNENCYFGRNLLDYNYVAVTGACLLIKADKYKQVQGFNEKLPVSYNDIDLCLKLYEAGYYNVVRTDVILYHHESISRGYDILDEEKKSKLFESRDLLCKLHPEFPEFDPFYNRNLTQVGADFSYNLSQIQKECEIMEKSIAVSEAKNIRFNIDSINTAESILITGWAFISQHKDNNKLYKQLILEQGEKQYIAETYRVYRPDVVEAFPDEKNIEFSGFRCEFSKAKIQPGNYNLSIICGEEKVGTGHIVESAINYDELYQQYLDKYKYLIERKTDYEYWIEDNADKENHYEKFAYNPKISIIVPVYNVLDKHLIPCIESVVNQLYDNWELCLADDCSTWESVRKTLKGYENNPKIKIVYRTENGHISRSSNSALEVATGEFVAFLDCDDLLSPNALYEVVKLLNKNRDLDYIYSDEDKIDDNGKKRKDPFFKPDWSPDTLMSCMYTCHFSVYRRSIANEIGGLRIGYEGSQDHDFALRFTEKTNKIAHIPEVLYHWRTREESTSGSSEAKPYTIKAAYKSKVDALERRGLNANMEFIPVLNQYRVDYISQDNPLISIILQTKDNCKKLEKCLSSIVELTEYTNYEIVLIDNNSLDNNRKYNKKLAEKYNCNYYYLSENLGFSKICNMGSELAGGTYYLFMNDALQVIQADWLNKMIGHAELRHTGAVGTKILTAKDGKILHMGIVNLERGPVYAYHKLEDSAIFLFGRNRIDFNYVAVSSCCLLVSGEKFKEVGGFNKLLSQRYSEVEFCFRLIEAGFYNVLKTGVVMIAPDIENTDHILWEQQDNIIELRKMNELHPNFAGADPFYNHHLCSKVADYSFVYDSNHREYSNASIGKLEGTVSSDVMAAIDTIKIDDDTIIIVGWAFIRGVLDNNDSVVRLSLNNSEHSYMISTEKVYRPDLANVFTEESLLDFTGFKTYIKKSDICCGNYTISVECNSKIANTNWDITV